MGGKNSRGVFLTGMVDIGIVEIVVSMMTIHMKIVLAM